ncbi:MAG: hypothetical protein PHS54_01230 [Clostridia bacterium]|nr:hypothetical protein [Clostridia bacterium]
MKQKTMNIIMAFILAIMIEICNAYGGFPLGIGMITLFVSLNWLERKK